MVPATLWSEERQEAAQIHLADTLHNASEQIDNRNTWEDGNLDRGELYLMLGAIAEAHMLAVDATPEQTLDRLKYRATRRLMAGGLVVIDWAVAILAAVGAIAAAVQHEPQRITAWLTLLVAAIVANKLLTTLPLCPDDERTQLRVLLARDLSSTCPECGQQGHIPPCGRGDTGDSVR